MDQLLTDLVPYEGDKEVLLHWDNFSHPVSQALQKLLSRMLYDESWRPGISFNHLDGILLSDLMQTPIMGDLRPGERSKNQILEELRDVFGSFESEGTAFVASPEFDFDLVLEPYPDLIDTALNLEQLIQGILDAYNAYKSIDERTLAVIQGRLPAFLKKLRTLEEIGAEFSVTKERVRQIERKYADLEIDPAKKESKLCQSLIDVLESSQSENDFILKASDNSLLGNEPLSLIKLKAILQILGLEALLTRAEKIESSWDLANQARTELGDLAQKYRNKLGLVDLAVFTSETGVSDNEAFEAIKTAYPRSIMRGRLVLARTSKLDTMFENSLGKQLMVFGSLDPETLLIGVERQASYRQAILLGVHTDQIAIVKALAGDIPTYETLRENTHEEPELNQTDLWFLEIFQDSPSGMMHRNEITAAAMRDGKNMSSVGVFLLFNPLIRPVGSSVMALANAILDQESIQLHANVAKAVEDKTHIHFEFIGSDILLKVTPNMNTLMAGVLFPSAELRALIKDSVFDVSCVCGEMSSTQQLRLRPPNFWTGFTAALKHAMDCHQLTKGGQISIRLIFDDSKAVLFHPGATNDL
jgi:hypothetical protein